MSSSASSVGAISPFTHETCEQATSVVVAVTALATSFSGTARTFTPRMRATTSGPSRPGCSVSLVTISCPGPRSSPASTDPSPSLVEVFSATSSTAQPSTRAYASRSFVCPAWRASKCVTNRPSASWDSSASFAARTAALGTGPSVPAFRYALWARTGNSARRAAASMGAGGYRPQTGQGDGPALE